ncbi:MAG TPA: uroporphyrinogen-III C-methyltransferase [Vicinamibacterales bacterium]|jgi:uroporphyrinogen III methyltransferase/synthase
MPKSPCVYIVGAGPGDPGLMTVRGLRRLETADVVVYDHHIHARLLRSARADAEQIDVGPAAPRPLDQDAISLLLVEKAREGKTVVRLKWGDPFLFDSGGKEAIFLHEQQIPFEVIPGVPATVAVPAYAGIPLTYPGAGEVVTLVRGHEGESTELPPAEWDRLAGIDGTLVCYAAAPQVGTIVAALLAHGHSGDETAAIIYDGTTSAQQTVVAPLSQIAASARPRGAGMLVVGRVVGLREHLRWFDDRPLFGRRIVVTRSREQAADFVDMLEERGAETIQLPTIRIAPPDDPDGLDRAAAAAAGYDWIVFTSANAVDAFFGRLLQCADVRELKGVRLCAVGPSTAQHISRFGVRVDLVPDESRSEGVLEVLAAAGPLQGTRILLPRADIAREALPDQLRDAGAEVTEVVAYRTILAGPERHGDHDVYRMLLDRQIDAVTFTSASTVRSFARLLGEEQAADLLNTTVVAAIGPVTAEAAQQLGIRVGVMPKKYTIPDLVDALMEHFASS